MFLGRYQLLTLTSLFIMFFKLRLWYTVVLFLLMRRHNQISVKLRKTLWLSLIKCFLYTINNILLGHLLVSSNIWRLFYYFFLQEI
jgi:hypothetical protein